MAPIMNFLNQNRDVKKLIGKEEKEVKKIESVVENLKGV